MPVGNSPGISGSSELQSGAGAQPPTRIYRRGQVVFPATRWPLTSLTLRARASERENHGWLGNHQSSGSRMSGGNGIPVCQASYADRLLRGDIGAGFSHSINWSTLLADRSPE